LRVTQDNLLWDQQLHNSNTRQKILNTLYTTDNLVIVTYKIYTLI
jgi:hypothetical protein